MYTRTFFSSRFGRGGGGRGSDARMKRMKSIERLRINSN